MIHLIARFACCTWLTVAATAHADEGLARQNYLVHCGGCHGESGDGFEGRVPSLKNTFAMLAGQPRGRAYLLRVPGVTQSILDPMRLAEVMNWALREFSAPEAIRDITPFSADEIRAGRNSPLLEVTIARKGLAAAGN